MRKIKILILLTFFQGCIIDSNVVNLERKIETIVKSNDISLNNSNLYIHYNNFSNENNLKLLMSYDCAKLIYNNKTRDTINDFLITFIESSSGDSLSFTYDLRKIKNEYKIEKITTLFFKLIEDKEYYALKLMFDLSNTNMKLEDVFSSLRKVNASNEFLKYKNIANYYYSQSPKNIILSIFAINSGKYRDYIFIYFDESSMKIINIDINDLSLLN